MKRSRFKFHRKPSKDGKIQSPVIYNSPISIDSTSYIYKIIEFHEAASYVDNLSALGFLIQNVNQPYFGIVTRPVRELTLNSFIAWRNEVMSVHIEKSIPKSTVKYIFTLFKAANVTLNCGSTISQLPKWNGAGRDSRSRNIRVETSLFELIQDAKTTQEAEKLAKVKVDKIYFGFSHSANFVIDSYLSLLEASAKDSSSVEKGLVDFEECSIQRNLYHAKSKLLDNSRYVFGTNRFYLDPELRGILPSNVLLSCLIILKLKYPHNTDFWVGLTLDNITRKRSSIEIHNGIKGKTNKEVGSFVIINTDRELWRAITLVLSHHDEVNKFVYKYSLSRNREPRLFDYIVDLTNRDKHTKHIVIKEIGYAINNDFLGLTQSGYKNNFIKKFQLPNISLETLRNLSATKYFIDGRTISELQDLLGHSERTTTVDYIDQTITSEFLKHNMLTFCREYEKDIIRIENDELVTNDDGSVEVNGKKYFHIKGGAVCSDPKNSPVENVKNGVCSGRLCHSLECSNRRIILDRKSIWFALIKREYYRSNYYFMVAEQEKFQGLDMHDIVFNLALCRYIQQEKPDIYRELEIKINAKVWQRSKYD